jgi:putative ABC transport system permease protein
VLQRTFTPIDRSVYVTLEGIEAMHGEGEYGASGGAAKGASESGASRQGATSKSASSKSASVIEANKRRAAAIPKAPPAGVPMAMPGAEPPPGTPMVMPGAEPPPPAPQAPPPRVAEPAVDTAKAEAEHDHGDDQITAFFVGTKNRFEALMLQREMNTDLVEPLTAIIPGVALGELWQNIGSAEVGLRVIAMFAVLISITGMLVALYSSLEARRREMAILRAIGAGPRTILALLVLESTLLAFLGCLIGVALVYGGLALAQSPIEQRFGIHLALRALGETEYTYLALVMISGMLIGIVPAWKAYRTSLVDGLSPRA